MAPDLASLSNRQCRLASRPMGACTADTFEFTTEPIPTPGDGAVLVKTVLLSLDPAMRAWLNEGKNYVPPVGIGEVMRAGGVGEVVFSSHPGFAVGDLVLGTFGVQQFCLVAADQVKATGMTRIDTALGTPAQWLNVLGWPGMTAFFGLREIGQPKPGETVVVSGAAGAVGQLVGQIAKIGGCRVVGIAGGPAKCERVTRELGFDACIDYKAGSVRDGLRRHCPNGVDVYFDNVGGDILDTVLTRLALHARIVICGAISQYNNTGPVAGPKNYLSLLVSRARMQGMVVFDYQARFAEAVRELSGYLKDGRLKSVEDVVVGGIEDFPETLNKLFTGGNFGKLLMQLER